MQTQLTFLQVDSHANLSVLPGTEQAKKITDIYGLKCSEQLGKLNPASLWLKTLLDCSPFWSQRVYLKWKIKRYSFFSESETYPINKIIERVQRRVIATIIEQIGAEGYVLPTLEDGTPIVCCIPACAVNAPHRRDRIWFVAYRNYYGYDGAENRQSHSQRNNSDQAGPQTVEQLTGCSGEAAGKIIAHNNFGNGKKVRFQTGGQIYVDSLKGKQYAANTNGEQRCEGRVYKNKSKAAKRHLSTCNAFTNECNDWKNFPTQSPLCSGDDGLPTELDGIAFSKWRNESIKAYGNAIVHQVALEFFKVIEQFEVSK